MNRVDANKGPVTVWIVGLGDTSISDFGEALTDDKEYLK